MSSSKDGTEAELVASFSDATLCASLDGSKDTEEIKTEEVVECQCPERLVLLSLPMAGMKVGPLHAHSKVGVRFRVRGYSRFGDFIRYLADCTLDGSPLVRIEHCAHGNSEVIPLVVGTAADWRSRVERFARKVELKDAARVRTKRIGEAYITRRREHRRRHRKRKQKSVVDSVRAIVTGIDFADVCKSEERSTDTRTVDDLRQSLYSDLQFVIQQLDAAQHSHSSVSHSKESDCELMTHTKTDSVSEIDSSIVPKTVTVSMSETKTETTAAKRCEDSAIDWDTVPECIKAERVIGSHVRGTRKKHQIDSVYALLRALIGRKSLAQCRPIRLLDLGCGSGNVGLALAFALPQLDVTLVDFNAKCVQMCRNRAAEASLTNVRCLHASLQHLVAGSVLLPTADGSFDVAVAVHCCGDASDLVLELATLHSASAVVIPCCVGKVQHCESLSYPRSKWLSAQLSYDKYLTLSRAADHNAAATDCTEAVALRRLCKTALEWDRAVRVKESGLADVWLTKVQPNEGLFSSPKHDIIVAAIKLTRN